MHDRGSLTDTANNTASIDTREQSFETGIMRWICSNDCVLNADTNTIVNQTGNGVEACIFIGAKVVFIFYIDNQFSVGCFSDLAITASQPRRIAWITTGQNHCARKSVPAQDRCLLQSASI